MLNKEDNTDCEDYIGITLLSMVAKVYDTVLEERITGIIETEHEEEKSNFFRREYAAQDRIDIEKVYRNGTRRG